MRNTFIILLLFANPFFTQSQQFTTTWGKETSSREVQRDMKIIGADNSGTYAIQIVRHVVEGTPWAELLKYDPDNNLIYKTDFEEAPKDLICQEICYKDGQLLAFFVEHQKRSAEYRIYGAKVDKNSGAIIGKPQIISVHALDSKKEDFNFSIKSIENSRNWLLIEDFSALYFSKEVLEFDSDFKEQRKCRFTFPVDPRLLLMENIFSVDDGKWVFVGREMQPPAKRHDPIEFKRYTILLLGSDGKKERDFAPESDNNVMRGAIAGEVIPGHLFIGGILGPNRLSGTENKIFYYDIDLKSGTQVKSSLKNLTLNNEASSRKIKKDEDPIGAFQFTAMEVDPIDNTPIFIAEQSLRRNSYSSSGSSADFLTEDFLVFAPDVQGQIKWVTNIPKWQLEKLGFYGPSSGVNLDAEHSSLGSFFPAYSSFCSGVFGENLILIYNDEKKNLTVMDNVDDLKEVDDFKGSSIQAIILNLKSGKYQKKMVQEEQFEGLAPAPKFAIKSGTQFILCGRHVWGMKSKYNVGRITVK